MNQTQKQTATAQHDATMSAGFNQGRDAAIVAFTRAKTLIAKPTTAKQEDLVRRGIEIGAAQGDTDELLVAALKLAKPGTDDRICLRAGFVTGYAPDAPKGSKAEKAAQNRFDYLAAKFSPGTSRKARHNAAKRAKGGGRKAKTAGEKTVMSEKTMARNVVATLRYVVKMQEEHAGDEEICPILGKIAELLTRK